MESIQTLEPSGNTHIGEERYIYLMERNLDMIKYLESVVKVLTTKYHSRYEDPNDELFVG